MAKERFAAADMPFDTARCFARSDYLYKAKRFDKAAGSDDLDSDNSDKAADLQTTADLNLDNADKADCLKPTSHYDSDEVVATDLVNMANGLLVAKSLAVAESADPAGWTAPGSEYFAAPDSDCMSAAAAVEKSLD